MYVSRCPIGHEMRQSEAGVCREHLKHYAGDNDSSASVSYQAAKLGGGEINRRNACP